MPEFTPHPAALEEHALLAQCDQRRQRRSGPGGQHRNKVETAIVLTHRASGLLGQASERRSQADNRKMAIFRLRTNLALSLRTERGEPSILWQSRCLKRRIHVRVNHDDFPTLLAEVLDVLALCDWNASDAAQRLQCSLSQLLKFLKLEPRAWLQLNEQRQQRGLSALR